MTTLDDALIGIVVNVLLYTAIIVGVIFSTWPTLPKYRSRPLQLYCLYLALQAPFRSDPAVELVRSLSMIVMLLSADWMAAIAVGLPRYANRLLRSMWWTMAGTVAIGIVIGLVLRDSVNWGNDLSPSFAQTLRGEFFFFHVLPHYGFALSLAVLVSTMRRPGLRFLVALGSVVVVPVLAARTTTRTIVFGVLLVTLVFLFRYARKTLLAAGIGLALALVLWPSAGASVADRLRVSSFVSSDPGVDPTNGRLALVLTNLRSFRDSPIFGQGAVEARRRVEVSDSRAKSEHGYSLHLASSGLFSVLLFAYVIQGLIAGIKIVLHRERAWPPRDVGPYEIAIAAVAIASFFTGFIWTFSSATAFYEWLAIFFVSAARVTWQMISIRRVRFG
jgi:hypothetical protein